MSNCDVYSALLLAWSVSFPAFCIWLIICLSPWSDFWGWNELMEVWRFRVFKSNKNHKWSSPLEDSAWTLIFSLMIYRAFLVTHFENVLHDLKNKMHEAH